MSKPLMSLAATAILAGCLSGPAFLKQEGSATADAAAIAAPVQQDAGGVLTAQVAAGSGVSQRVSASAASAVAGSAVVFPPGSLAVSTSVTIQEGSTIAAPALANQLGLGSSNTISPASNAIVISSTARSDAATPFTIDLPLSSGAGLVDAMSNLIIVYTVFDASSGRNLAGVIPTSQLTLSGSSVRFATVHFGQFQAAYAAQPVTASVSIPTTAPVLTAVAASALPAVVWQPLTGTYDSKTSLMQVSGAASGLSTLSDCVAAVAVAGNATPFFSASLGAALTGTFTMPPPAFGQYQARLSCSETNGRLSTSPWSTAFSLGTPPAAPAPAPAPAPGVTPAPGTATLPIAVLSGQPPALSNQPQLKVSIAGQNVSQYQYAVTALASSCVGATYSAWMSTSIPITSLLGSDGPKTLCVLARDGSGNTQVTPTTYTWTLQTAPLTVTGRTPADHSTGVSATLNLLTVQFSAALQPPPCNAIELFLGTPGPSLTSQTSPCTQPSLSGLVAGTQSYANGVLSFAPQGSLNLNAPYAVVLPSNLSDLAGNAYSAPTPWSFTTADGSWQSPPVAPPGAISTLTPLSNYSAIASNQAGSTVLLYTGNASGSPKGVYAMLYTASGGWSAPVRLDAVDADAPSALTAAIDRQGNVSVLWVQQDPSGPVNGVKLFANYFNVASGWTFTNGGGGAPELVANLTPYATGNVINNVNAVADSNGFVHAVWYQNPGGGGPAYVSTSTRPKGAGQAWSSAYALSVSQTSVTPSLSSLQYRVNGRGDAFVVWTPYVAGGYSGGVFSSVMPATNTNIIKEKMNETATSPNLLGSVLPALDEAGDAFLYWSNYSSPTTTIRSNYLAAGSTSAAAWADNQIAQFSGSAQYLAMGMNALGTARLVWYDATGGFQSRIFAGGSLIAGTQVIAASNPPVMPPTVAVDNIGNAHVAWYSGSTTGSYIVRIPSGSLSNNPTSTTLYSSILNPPFLLTTDPIGNAMLVAVDSGSAYASRYQAGSPTWPSFVTSFVTGGSLFMPLSLATTATGQTNFVWATGSTAAALTINLTPFR